ncbi:DUF3221 domain-containing protein [Halobacillus sp. ACCC02827]|uniref:DUF3221 domain-containing protein n=1 Tax=unclassified Halobacillus TaxID=2636472 RepID=UPI000785E2D5|nr:MULTISPECIES: DUF3221 domain-containing protein [unclassified Halobacillus]WJE15602.1 DUF3221 domain-containing protein [Halobacillus sp. ACCC02827]
MRNIWTMMGAACLILLAGCSSAPAGSDYEETEAEAPPEQAEISGYVMEQEGSSILVVTPTTESEEKGRAMWVSEAPDNEWTGKYVDVWTDGPIKESFPEQAPADKVSEVEMSEVEGARLTTSEALASALTDVEDDKIVAVAEILFDEDDDQWQIVLKENEGPEKEVLVEDE